MASIYSACPCFRHRCEPEWLCTGGSGYPGARIPGRRSRHQRIQKYQVFDWQFRAEAYTTLHDSDVFLARNVFGLLRGDSLSTTGTLYETISKFIDKPVLDAVAREG